MTAQEAKSKVLEAYPDAYAAFLHGAITNSGRNIIRRRAAGEKNPFAPLCNDYSHSEDEAWINAASYLPSPVEPKAQVESASTIGRSQGYSIPLGTHQTASFWQGFAMALASVNRSFDNPTIVKSVMDGFGVDIKLLRDSNVEAYDLKEIRK